MGDPLETAPHEDGQTLSLAWPDFAPGATSYNVYANSVLQGNTTQRTYTVTGLHGASYDPASQVKTPPLDVHVKIGAILAGNEVASLERIITMPPSSVQLTTPMRRPFPFPNVRP